MVACEENYHRIGFRTVMMWYLDLHSTTTGDFCFTKSARGSSLAAATSPFQEVESLLVQFKAWARSDLEHLTIKKSTEWTNKKLLAGWTMENLKAMNISACQRKRCGKMDEGGWFSLWCLQEELLCGLS